MSQSINRRSAIVCSSKAMRCRTLFLLPLLHFRACQRMKWSKMTKTKQNQNQKIRNHPNPKTEKRKRKGEDALFHPLDLDHHHVLARDHEIAEDVDEVTLILADIEGGEGGDIHLRSILILHLFMKHRQIQHSGQ